MMLTLGSVWVPLISSLGGWVVSVSGRLLLLFVFGKNFIIVSSSLFSWFYPFSGSKKKFCYFFSVIDFYLFPGDQTGIWEKLVCFCSSLLSCVEKMGIEFSTRDQVFAVVQSCPLTIFDRFVYVFCFFFIYILPFDLYFFILFSF